MPSIVCLHTFRKEKVCDRLFISPKRRYISALAFLIAFLLTGFDGHAQVITMSVENVKLEKVLESIRKQTGYTVVYQDQVISKAVPVTLTVKNIPLQQALKKIFEGQPALTYEIVDNKVISIKENTTPAKPAPAELPGDLIITGKVADNKGVPIADVTVTAQVKSIFTAVKTDPNGNFSIALANGPGTLIFSHVGYDAKKLPFTSPQKISQPLSIVLDDQPAVLTDMIVIGYGRVNRRDLTGSVGTVNVADINKAPVKSFDDALAGRVAGVQVSSPDGQPGATPSIVIRGGNSITQTNGPLFVIDGFPIEDYDNNAINPADIESIEVLKDASSTAIYGARGANGVIIITTKKGKAGAPVVTYNGYYGLQENTSTVDVLDPYEFVKYQYELDPTKATSLYLQSGKTIESYKNEPGINWQDQLFRTAPMQSHNIAVRGGNATTKYALSGSLLEQEGTIIASGFKRYQGRVALDQDINKKLRVGINTNYTQTLSYGTQVGGGLNTALNLLINTWQYRPITGNGNLDDLLNDAQDVDVVSATNYQWNPILSANNELRDRTTHQLIANAYLEYDLLPELKLKIVGGINSNKLRVDEFNNSLTRLGNPGSPLGTQGVNGSVMYYERMNYLNENTLTYKKTFNNNHHVTMLGGFTVQRNRVSIHGARAVGIPNESLGISGLDEGIPFRVDASESENKLVSFLGRLNYNFKSNYLFTVSFRADGSSKFPAHKFGYFPSAAIAWNLAEEQFMKNISFLSESKLRMSIGVTGNNRVDDYAAYAKLEQGGQASYTPGGNFVSGATPVSLGNPDLKWERTKDINIGLDLGFLHQRITLTTDVYKKTTTDLLLETLLPTSSGYLSAFQNIGSVSNQGVEFSLNTINLKRKNFSWSSSFNIAFNRTKVLGLTQNQTSKLTGVRWNSGNAYAQNFSYIAQIGEPVAMYYGYKWAGNYQYSDFDQPTPGTYVLKTDVPNNGSPRANIKPGDIRYEDIFKDGVIDSKDLGIIGNPNPDFFGGFTNNFTYKGFDLNVFFQFVYGNEILHVNRLVMEGVSNVTGANQFATMKNRWTPENQTNALFRVGGSGPAVYSDRIIEDGSFIRLKTINIGYRIDPGITKRMKISSIRAYVSAQNLVTWTSYSGNDPEVSVFSSALTPGMDYSAYPRARVVTVGLDLSF